MGALCVSHTMKIFIPSLILFVLALIFAVALAYLGKKLAVKHDVRIDEVRARLAGANCGACGYPGCDGFAAALVEGKAELSSCSVTSAENKQEIASILGITAEGGSFKVVVCCRGGNDAKDRYDYMGYGDCRSMQMLAGGRKQCRWGCLGMGTCVDACLQHAAEVNMRGYSEIHQEKCIQCGLCITACPKNIIKRVPDTAKYYVACSNHDRGKDVRDVCAKGCIACGLCVKACAAHMRELADAAGEEIPSEPAIRLVDNLPVIDYDRCLGCGKCAEKCPRECILPVDGGKIA